MCERIIAVCEEFPRYGYRRVTHHLRAEGMSINHKAAARIMRENDLQVRPLRGFVQTTNSDHENPIFPNLAANLVPDGPNQLWVADLSYVAIAVGFVYVAVILDAWSSRVVGYAISRRIDTRLTLAALRAAVEARRPPPGCIHHSNRGGQYAADQYRQALANFGLLGSMGRRGNPYDNAKAESFMKTLKCEQVYLNEYRNFAEVVERVPSVHRQGLQHTQIALGIWLLAISAIRGAAHPVSGTVSGLISVQSQGVHSKVGQATLSKSKTMDLWDHGFMCPWFHGPIKASVTYRALAHEKQGVLAWPLVAGY